VTEGATTVVPPADPSARQESDPAAPGPSTAATALVANPVKVDDLGALRASVTARCHELGLPALTVYETTPEDPGTGQAREAVAQGATLVLVAGGDGTVRAVAEGLVHTGVPLGILPQGTGNLLVRNLGLPVDADKALEVALTGTDRTLDVGRIEVEGSGRTRQPPDRSEAETEHEAEQGTVFAVMAGAGLDAAMMRDAPEGLKKAVGWPAYLVGGARGLRRRRMRVQVRLDGGEPKTAKVRTVLIGNMGQLQGGLELLSDALPDDGLLDVALVAPRRAHDWVVLIARGLTRRHRPDRRLQTFQARHVSVRLDHAQPRQLDGDLIAEGVSLEARVEPGALLVRVPPEETA